MGPRPMGSGAMAGNGAHAGGGGGGGGNLAFGFDGFAGAQSGACRRWSGRLDKLLHFLPCYRASTESAGALWIGALAIVDDPAVV